MPPPAEWFDAHLQSVRLGLDGFALRFRRVEKGSRISPVDYDHGVAYPFEQLLDVVRALNTERQELHARLSGLEVALTPVQPARAGRDPLRPLFDALESINEELIRFAGRLARLEDAKVRAERQPDFRQAAICPRASAGKVCAVRCRRRVGQEVPRA